MNATIRPIVCLILALPFAARSAAQTGPVPAQAQVTSSTMAINATQPAWFDQLRETSQRAESNIARLQIDRWKTSPAEREQARSASESIRRNLSYAVPELMQKLHDAPASLSANFRLYRNLNALYDTFSLLVAGAGTFAGREQASDLDADLAQIDSIRRQLAERIDQLAVIGDAELTQARSRPAAPIVKLPSRIVVDDNKSTGRKSKSTPASQH